MACVHILSLNRINNNNSVNWRLVIWHSAQRMQFKEISPSTPLKSARKERKLINFLITSISTSHWNPSTALCMHAHDTMNGHNKLNSNGSTEEAVLTTVTSMQTTKNVTNNNIEVTTIKSGFRLNGNRYAESEEYSTGKRKVGERKREKRRFWFLVGSTAISIVFMRFSVNISRT